ncbi:2-oxo-4-hydroxy-4-carboxy-5-ureidoimidazoline decarboxylase [Cellulomonas marina]|uniref:2-oxo-4-hydroxy-4-carboxy-5-ureidoimidazoline decarboxylase n=1 Tax=Cellulomonas marina TaxID=988821 RepID=A0A1I0ZQ16_9CELL|nr:2-oxo-4-hydroxy-4-carboxy-5-ureidoimidazoline decarboxylase [Cellulomonas marina]GIG28879.1 OHCU decarboxylase [Cellulomonas marina]SFB27206.1 2-oxo-4-hydroxy-4-carboxy-5-ureidoimidazoline decarboxylase [Cellulomonas marina]
MDLSEFDTAPPDEARAAAGVWAAVPSWVDALVAGRPWGDLEALAARADALARTWTRAEVEAALAHHPRIGERPVGDDAGAAASRREQAAVAGAGTSVTEALAAGNAAYERRFDRVFLIRAAGRSPEEILAHLRRRLDADPDEESAEVADQLRQIALLRLRTSLTAAPAAAPAAPPAPAVAP